MFNGYTFLESIVMQLFEDDLIYLIWYRGYNISKLIY